MRQILKIAQREYQETIKTKTFLLSIVMTPLLIIGIGYVNSRLTSSMKNAPKPQRWVAIVDLSGKLREDLAAAFKKYNDANAQRQIQIADQQGLPAEPEGRIETWRRAIDEGRIHGLLVVAKDAADEKGGAEPSQYYAKTKNINDLDTYGTMQRLLNEAVTAARYRRHNLSPQLIAELSRPVPLNSIEVGAKTPSTGRSGPNITMIMVPFFFMFLMFMSIMGSSQGMLTSVIEEKNSRVIEVLLAAVSPQKLMAGKILGLVGVGLTLVGIWGAAAAVAATRFGMSGAFNPMMLGWFTIFFILGFAVVASLYAAIGSACNTLKEAQNLLGPVTMFIVLPMIVWMPIAQNPNGTLALVLSYVPTTAPMVMVVRLCADPALPLGHVLGSLVALLASTVAIVWAAGKIFRTGILMYGKPPTLRELARWVRAR